jgi:predicted GNAT family N-acyltransferase
MDFNNICFGIEFETCVCDKKNPGQQKGYHSFLRYYTGELQKLYSKKLKNDTEIFKYIGESKSHRDYTIWAVTEDASIKCRNDNLYPNISGINERISEDIYFNDGNIVECAYEPVELVSPIVSDLNMADFFNIFENIIRDPTFQYQSNESQGMHVNVSHPRQNKLKMLKLWWCFEPIILQFIPAIRRNSKFVKTVRSVFQNIQDIDAKWEDYYINPDEPPAKYMTLCVKANRFEFRLVNANMSTAHLKAWVGLCSNLVYLSTLDTVQMPDTENKNSLELFEELFSDDYIKDRGLKEYFAHIYEQYKSPEYDRIYEISKILNTDVEIDLPTYELLLKYKFIDCDSIFIRILEKDKDQILLENFMLKYKVEITYNNIFNNFLLIEHNRNLFDDYQFTTEQDFLLDLIINQGFDGDYDIILNYSYLQMMLQENLDIAVNFVNFLLDINPYGNEMLSNSLIAYFSDEEIPLTEKISMSINFKNIKQIQYAVDVLPEDQQEEVKSSEENTDIMNIAKDYLSKPRQRFYRPSNGEPDISFEIRNNLSDFSQMEQKHILYVSKKSEDYFTSARFIGISKSRNRIISIATLNERDIEFKQNILKIPSEEMENYALEYTNIKKSKLLVVDIELLQLLLQKFPTSKIYAISSGSEHHRNENIKFLEINNFNLVRKIMRAHTLFYWLFRFNGPKQAIAQAPQPQPRPQPLPQAPEIIQFEYKKYENFSQKEQHRIFNLVKGGGQVNPDTLIRGLMNCQIIGVAKSNDTIVSVGALKIPNESYRQDVLTKAGIPEKDWGNYVYEYGYAITDQAYRGRGLSTTILAQLLTDASNVFATVRSKNSAERHILKKYNFVAVGKTYDSSDRTDKIVLYKHI